MSGPADARRRPSTGTLDPTVRGLLRSFLSPAIADNYAAALQPVASADRDAAIAGAVSALRARFGVRPEEIAIVLVQDTGWSVADASTLLGIPVSAIRDELAHPDAPRIGPSDDVNPLDDDEAAAVDAMLAGVPSVRQRGEDALAAIDEDDVDVEMSTSLPAHVGLASLEERIAHADRRQRQVVNATIVAVIALVALTFNATRPDDVVDLGPSVTHEDPDPEEGEGDDGATEAPTEDPGPAVPTGPAQIAEARFVDEVDPATGAAGPALTEATTTTDVRIWLRFDQMPRGDVLVELRFTGPDGTRTVRPVLVPAGLPLVSVRLPEELGREPGRYGVVIDVEGLEPLLVEVRLTNPGDTLDPGDLIGPSEAPSSTEDGLGAEA